MSEEQSFENIEAENTEQNEECRETTTPDAERTGENAMPEAGDPGLDEQSEVVCEAEDEEPGEESAVVPEADNGCGADRESLDTLKVMMEKLLGEFGGKIVVKQVLT